MSKTIRINDEVESYLNTHGKYGESPDDVLKRSLLMSEEPLLVKPEQAAAMLAMHPATLARMAKAGHIKQLRTPGGAPRYAVADLKAYVEKMQSSVDTE